MVAEPVVVITTGLVADDVVDEVVVLSDVFKASTADPSEKHRITAAVSIVQG